MVKSSKQKIINTNTSVNNNDNAIVKTKRKRKSIPRESPQKRSSVYRGVTRHRWTGRFEAHLWDKNSWNDSQNKKGKQVYLGAYDDEEAAAHAYDLAALKYWGQDTILNFPSSTYEEELKEMDSQTKEEYIGSLRRKSSGFSRGVSKFRGVARHHHNGRWEARIGRVFGNKYLYLGTYATQEEAATAYDLAAIEYRGVNAVTNFDVNRYVNWIRPLQIKPNEPQPSPNDSNDGVINFDVSRYVNWIRPLQIKSNEPQPSPNDSNDAQVRSLSCLNVDQNCPSPVDQTTNPLLGPTCGTATSSALGLLLQSSKYNDTLKHTRNFNSPSSSLELDPPRSCFPDDIQTSFEFQDASSYTDENDIIFGDCDTLKSPMFQCEF